MAHIVIVKKDIGKILQAGVDSVAQKNKIDSLFDTPLSQPIELGLTLVDPLVAKKLEKDAVVRKVLKAKVEDDYKEFQKTLATLSVKSATAYFQALAKVSDDKKAALKQKFLKKLREDASKEVTAFGTKAHKPWNEEIDKYFRSRQTGSREEKKATVKKTKAVVGVVGGVAGTGAAIAGSIVTLGAATPGAVAAAYGTYLAAMECYKSFRNDAKTVDDLKASILKSIKAIEDDYNSKDTKKAKSAMLKTEAKAKAADTFLGKNGVASIKKLETDIKQLRKAVSKSVLTISRTGKELTAHIENCEELITLCTRIEKSGLGGVDFEGLAKALKKEKELKAARNSVADMIKGATDLRKQTKDKAKELSKAYIGLQKLDTDIADFEKTVAGWKDNRPEAVRHIGNAFKAAQVIFQVAAAASSMGASSTSFVPAAERFVALSPDGLSSIGTAISDAVLQINDATGAAKKAYDKARS